MGIQSYSLYHHVASLQLDELSVYSAKVLPESVSNQRQINNHEELRIFQSHPKMERTVKTGTYTFRNEDRNIVSGQGRR